MDRLHRRLEGQRLAEVERFAGDDVDGAGHAAFDQVGGRGLVDHHLADDLGRQQRIAGAAADGAADLVEHEPVARGQRMAVDGGLGQAGRGAAQADTVVLVEAAGTGRRGTDVHARQALQRVGDVLVGHLPHVFGGDDFDVRGSVTLDRQRLLQGSTDAGHHDRVDRRIVGRRLLRRRRVGCAQHQQRDGAGRRRQRGMEMCVLALAGCCLRIFHCFPLEWFLW
jgi:hypothetical protein